MNDQEMTLSQFVNYVSGLRDQAPYSSTVTQNDYKANHTGTDQQTIKIENRLSDTKDVVFYKEWRDEYRNENGERPDISLDIYQLLTDENGNKELSLYYKDYSWSKLDSNTEVQSQDDMWSITFKELPKYDDYGKEIIYYAKENVIINRDTFDYLDAQYYYKIDDKTVKVGDEVDGPLSGYENAGYLYPLTENDQQTFLLKENGMFVNQIEKNIEINGKKIWRDLPSGYSEDNLPKVVLQLYQCDSNGNKLNDGNPYATIEISDWKKLKNSEGNYVFAFKYKGANTNHIDENGDLIVTGETDAKGIPQYDEDGKRYTYRIEEDIQFVGEGSQQNDGNVYVKDYDNNAYMITNNYQSVKGDLAVKKIIANADLKDGEKYPDVTFTLERSYMSNGGSQITDNNFKRTGTIKYNEFNDNGIAYYTFSDLDVYAPNGSLYQYKVTETAINGYKTEVGSGDLDINSSFVESFVSSDVTLTPKSSIGVINAIKAALNQAQTKTVTFKNTYTPEIISIQGQKIWNDDRDSAGLRPNPQSDEMTLTLTRYANAQPGSSNNIKEQKLTNNDYDLTWTGTESNTWTYEIKGKTANELEKYAPNGMPWIYRVKEEMKSPADDIYVKAPSIGNIDGIVEKNASYVANGIVEMDNLTNTLLTSISGTKNWDITDDNPNDILNDYLGYQMDVEFELQAKIKGYIRNESATPFSDSWENANSLIEQYTYNSSVLEKYALSRKPSGSLYFGQTATVQFDSLYNAIRVENSSITGQDIQTGDIILLEYRVIEKGVTIYNDEKTISFQFKCDDDEKYFIENVNNGENIFNLPEGINGKILNQLSTTSLTITKNWVNDNHNIYGTRPTINPNSDQWITRFVVQRRSTGNSQWENVKKYTNGKDPIDYVVSITGNDNEDSKSITINDLPQYGYIVDENTNSLKRVEYQYRVRELRVGELESILKDEDIITGEESNKIFNDTYTVEYDASNQDGHECIVTNTLETIDQVAATKNWENKDEFTKNVTFEIKYLTEDENGDQHWTPFDPAAQVVLNGQKDDMTGKAYGENKAWKAIWNGLPKHMPGSKVENGQTIYKVFEIADNGLYVEESIDSNQSQVFTNTPTKLQVQKIVDMGAYKGTLNTKYQFTITKLQNDNTSVDTSFNGNYQYRITQDQQGETNTLKFTEGKATFNLKHNQTITIYGLPKGFSYSVVENGVSGDLSNNYTTYVSLNDGEFQKNGSYLLNITSEKQTTTPKATFKNLYEGQIHIQKNDEFGNALKDVKFKIEYCKDTDLKKYESIDETVCSNVDLVNANGELVTNQNGQLTFTGLKLGYSYRITEVSSISNHNKLIEPIIIELPVLTDSQSSDTIKSIGKVGDKFVYTQVTYTITNNAALDMPTTGRQHLYYFGVAGFAVIALACGYWIMSDKKKKKVRK